MKIAVLGGSGRTGKYLVEYALSQGYKVKCLVRNSQEFQQSENLQVFEGNPLNEIDMEKVMQGCDGIVSVLNISRTSDFPWAKLRTPKDFLSKVMAMVILKAAHCKIKRILICSAWGVAETRMDIPFWFRWTIDYSNIKYAYLDHEKQEQLLTNSESKWTIVRPTGLTNSNHPQEILETFDNTPKPHLTISRKSLAKYMVSCLRNDLLIGQKVVISKKVLH